MKRNIHKLIMFVSSLFLLFGCEREHLYYSVSETATIHFDLDWTESRLSPNGVSAWVYNSNGFLYKKFAPSDNYKEFNIALPEGNYNVLLFNNSVDEHSRSFSIIEDNKYSSVTAYSNFEKDRVISEPPILIEPDTLASAKIERISITREEIDFFYNKPSTNHTDYAKKYKVKPVRNTTIINITAHVKGLKYAAGAPKTTFTNASCGYKLGEDRYHDDDGIYSFILNNRTFDDDSKINGTIRKEFNSFGLIIRKGIEHFVNMDFVLINGEHYPINVNVTDLIKRKESYQPQIFIQFEVELPEVIGTDSGDGAFNTDVEEWEDIDVEIPL